MNNEQFKHKVAANSAVQFDLSLFPVAMLAEKMLEASHIAQGLDIYRKAMFYGQDNLGLHMAAALYRVAHPEWGERNIMGTYPGEDGKDAELVLTREQEEILHAILGIAAVSGNLIDVFIHGLGAVQRGERKPADGIDEEALLAQAGGIEWCITQLLSAIGKTREECFDACSEKLSTYLDEVAAGANPYAGPPPHAKKGNGLLQWNITEHGAKRGATLEHLGFIPQFISADDPRPAKEQIDEQYAHGGGWRKYEGFKLGEDNRLISQYPEEEDLHPIAEAQHNDEKLYFYDYAWTAIVQPDRSFEVACLD